MLGLAMSSKPSVSRAATPCDGLVNGVARFAVQSEQNRCARPDAGFLHQLERGANFIGPGRPRLPRQVLVNLGHDGRRQAFDAKVDVGAAGGAHRAEQFQRLVPRLKRGQEFNRQLSAPLQFDQSLPV